MHTEVVFNAVEQERDRRAVNSSTCGTCGGPVMRSMVARICGSCGSMIHGRDPFITDCLRAIMLYSAGSNWPRGQIFLCRRCFENPDRVRAVLQLRGQYFMESPLLRIINAFEYTEDRTDAGPMPYVG